MYCNSDCLLSPRKVWLKGVGNGPVQVALAREVVSSGAQSVEIPALMWRPLSVSDTSLEHSLRYPFGSKTAGFVWSACVHFFIFFD